MDARTRAAASRKGGVNVQGRATAATRAAGRVHGAGAGPDAAANRGAVCRDSHGVVGVRAVAAVATVGVPAAGTALPRGRADDERVGLIAAACNVAQELIRRAAVAETARDALPVVRTAGRTIDTRLTHGDRLAIYDAMVDAVEKLEAIRDRLADVLVDDADILRRLRSLHEQKPAYGTLPIIDGCRQAGDRVSEETAATDRGGRERPRSGRVNRKAPASQG